MNKSINGDMESFLNSKGDDILQTGEFVKKLSEQELAVHGIASPVLNSPDPSDRKQNMSDLTTLKEISASLKSKPTDKPKKVSKYEFVPIPWLEEKNKNDLATFDKAIWKLLNVLRTLCDQLKIFEEAALKSPGSKEIIQTLKMYQETFDKISGLKLYTNRENINGILMRYQKIAERAQVTEIPQSQVKRVKQLGIKTKKDPEAFKKEQLAISLDCKIKQEELKHVVVRINALYKETNTILQRLSRKNSSFESSFNDKVQEGEKNYKNTLSNGNSLLPKKVQFQDNWNFSTTVGRFFYSDNSDEVENKQPESTQHPPTKDELNLISKEVEEAIQFSKKLNWWLSEVVKWLENMAILRTARNKEFQNDKKIADEQKRFNALLETIQTQQKTLKSFYEKHIAIFDSELQIWEQPFETATLQWLLNDDQKIGNLAEQEKIRPQHFCTLQFHSTLLEKQWDLLATKINEMVLATKDFSNPPAPFSWPNYLWSFISWKG